MDCFDILSLFSRQSAIGICFERAAIVTSLVLSHNFGGAQKEKQDLRNVIFPWIWKTHIVNAVQKKDRGNQKNEMANRHRSGTELTTLNESWEDYSRSVEVRAC